MDTTPEEINRDRRRFFGTAALAAGAAGAAQLGMIGTADAQTGQSKPAVLPAAHSGTAAYFGPVKQVNAGVLNVGYVEAGPADGRPVILLQANRAALGELIWKFNSPTWDFSQATFDTTAAAFDNPDYVAVIIDNYRWRLDLVPGDPRYTAIEKELDAAPTIAVPTVTLDAQYDPFTPAGNGSAYRGHFTGKYAHYTLPVGHNVPQEDPRGFAEAVVEAGQL